MTIIEPIPLDMLNKEKFQTRLDLARELMVPDTLFIQIMAHAPGYGEALFDAMFQSHAIGNVDHSLKEIIRIRLTTISKDSYFAKVLKFQVLVLANLLSSKKQFWEDLFEICSFYFFAINKSVLICFLSWSTFLNFFSFLINFLNSTVKYLL